MRDLLGRSLVVRGREAILAYATVLEELCRLNDQLGEADNLGHFLTTPAALRKKPCLVLLKPEPQDACPTVQGFVGALLLFEYAVYGVGLKIYASSDFSGRRNVLGPEQLRARFCIEAWSVLRRRGAHIVFVDFQVCGSRDTTSLAIPGMLRKATRGRAQWALLESIFPMYLRLLPTVDATLAGIGQKTRANLRYYKRRAERELGCCFVPQAELDLEEYLAFNRVAAFSVPEAVAAARYAALQTLKSPWVCGLRSSDGRWLSIVTGWKRHTALEIEWQMNRADLPRYSLATVMRSYVIEHAIAEGFERLYIEGGTQQALQNSFERERVLELTVLRRSLYARLVQRFARQFFPADNHLGRILGSTDLQ
ncbi:MAG TPA: hypothetical protein VGD62_12420 [Acidobacteriaceae bacterium]